MLTPEETERYARHIVLADVGGAGQQKLKAARVLVVGAGGLGSPAIAYLAAAGVGTISVIDDDVVSLSNLQRQIIHGTDKIGASKVDSAREAARRINPHVRVETWPIRLTRQNGFALVALHDVVIDGSDNFDTRYALAEICEELKVPLVTAAVGQFDGSITTLKPYASDSDGNPLPRYRDLFPNPPPPGAVPTCAEAGIVGALTGVMGAMQAMEAIKEITGAGDSLAGRLVLYDARAGRFDTMRYRRATGAGNG
jgi:molybdopterin/thiamine biosynthesis adenylyltransferase